LYAVRKGDATEEEQEGHHGIHGTHGTKTEEEGKGKAEEGRTSSEWADLL
jgi:hypothetical protein